jgi:hypothetical protein
MMASMLAILLTSARMLRINMCLLYMAAENSKPNDYRKVPELLTVRYQDCHSIDHSPQLGSESMNVDQQPILLLGPGQNS